jgi:hypothetical protein
MLISCLFIPLLSHLITNQVSIWSLRSSWARPHRCSYSDSGNSATASIVGPAPLDPSQHRGGHQQEERSRHPDRWSLGPYPPHLTACTLCSYKCLCHSWYHLISEPEYRKELPQFVAGFMYDNWKGKRWFASFTSEYPSFSFLSFSIQDLVISDCCRGLFLC